MTDLRLEHVSKRYRVQRKLEPRGTRRPLLQKLSSLRSRREEFWAVSDVSFEVAHGETLGIIGHNGAGKSTILKLLSNVTAPTSGEITITGRLSALIEVGSGFHQELTGRENIYLSGSILGMRRREIAAKLERIIEFAGVRDFIDMPVKHYSSGMYLRLGFSIAAHLEPDILLLDEVLAVGDAAFQVKCLDRINDLHDQGRTIVFISHDLGAVERLCGRVILMDHGQMVAAGPAKDIIARYQAVGASYTPSTSHAVADAILSREAEIASVNCYDADDRPSAVFRTGLPAKVRLNYVVHAPVLDAIFEVYIYSIVAGLSGPWC
jgi:lipopolysaccharide transport system ATP-binding protein